MAELSHAWNSAPAQRRPRPESACTAHPRRQARFFRHVVRECPLKGLLPGSGLHPGRADGARADPPRYQTEGWLALHRVVQGADEDAVRQRRPGRSAYLLHAAELPARVDAAAAHPDRTDAQYDGDAT